MKELNMLNWDFTSFCWLVLIFSCGFSLIIFALSWYKFRVSERREKQRKTDFIAKTVAAAIERPKKERVYNELLAQGTEILETKGAQSKEYLEHIAEEKRVYNSLFT